MRESVTYASAVEAGCERAKMASSASDQSRYYADAHAETAPTEPTTTPTGVAIFAEDFQTIRKLAERDHKGIVSWNRYERGSHFAPQDAPDLLLDDIRRFFRELR
jgi:epoxide hydrolase